MHPHKIKYLLPNNGPSRVLVFSPGPNNSFLEGEITATKEEENVLLS